MSLHSLQQHPYTPHTHDLDLLTADRCAVVEELHAMGVADPALSLRDGGAVGTEALDTVKFEAADAPAFRTPIYPPTPLASSSGTCQLS